MKSDMDAFEWQRPPVLDRHTLTAAACVEQARAMERTLKQRERQIHLLVKELNRVNKENFRLSRELEGFRGLKRQELLQENRAIRGYLNRVVKENLTLRGQHKMMLNPRVSASTKDQLDSFANADGIHDVSLKTEARTSVSQ